MAMMPVLIRRPEDLGVACGKPATSRHVPAGFTSVRRRAGRTRSPWAPPMAEPIAAPMIASSSNAKEAIMRWLASNWLFILFVVGMVWMHLGHGGHGGHGNGHQHGRPARRGESDINHAGHSAAAQRPSGEGTASTSTGPRRAA